MTDSVADLARKRRYQIRRSQVRAAVKGGTNLAVDKMSDYALWAVLMEELTLSETAAAGSMSVEVYMRARRALEVARELKERGTQLGLGF